MSLCILSCAYEHPERAKLLQESCDHFGLPLVMCGGDDKWPGTFRKGKIIAAWEAILYLRKEFGHVLWTDGFDSIVTANANKILSKFYVGLYAQSYAPMVFSVETNCYPDSRLAGQYLENPCSRRDEIRYGPWKYLNAGGWIGRTDYVLKAIETALEHTPPRPECRDSDQYIWSRAFLDGMLPRTRLDHAFDIFRTMWRQETRDCLPEEEVGDACVVHYNGAVHMDGYRRMAEHWKRVKAGFNENDTGF
jgi:hypothetical protein